MAKRFKNTHGLKVGDTIEFLSDFPGQGLPEGLITKITEISSKGSISVKEYEFTISIGHCGPFKPKRNLKAYYEKY